MFSSEFLNMSIVTSLFFRFEVVGLCAIEFAVRLTIRIADEEWRLTRSDSMHPWDEHDPGEKQTDDTSRGIITLVYGLQRSKLHEVNGKFVNV